MSFGGLGKSGGLSINTGAAGSSLFGGSSGTSQPQSGGGGLFGSSTATSQPQSGGLFGGGASSNATSQPQGSSLFGGALNKPATPNTTAQPQSGSLFGGALGQNTQQQGQQQQSQGGGLFGNAAQPAQAAAPSLFGGSTAQPQNKPSLFSNAASTPAQPQQQQPSFFGGGMSTNQQPAAAGGLFGSTAQNAGGGAQPTVPGVRIDISQIRGSTRFSDLHEDLQKHIEQMDNVIQQQISQHDQCQGFMDGRLKEFLGYLPHDVEWVSGMCDAVETALDNDSQSIAQLKETFKKDAENARVTFRVVENLKLPSQFHYQGSMWNPGPQVAAKSTEAPADEDSNTDLVALFNSQTEAMDKTLETQARLLTEIEQHLRTVEASTLQQTQELMARRGAGGAEEHRENRLRELAQLFQEIQKAILYEAQKVGDCREKVIEATVGSDGALGGFGR